MNELIKTLESYNQWVCWKPQKSRKDNKVRKVPINPKTGDHASSTDSKTWSGYCGRVRNSPRRGFVLTDTDPFIVVDLDHCIGSHGRINLQATKILLYFQSYTEISPSGTGVHIWVKGTMPGAIKRKEFEFYSDLRYMTVTENPLFNCPLVDCQSKLDLVWKKYGKPFSVSETGPINPYDCLVDLRKIYKVSTKMREIWNLECDFFKADGSPDCSAYDMALAGLLRDWSSERIFWAIEFMRVEHGFAPKHSKAIIQTIQKAKT